MNASAHGKLQHIVLAELRPLQKTADHALMHHGNPVTHANHLFHIARNHQDGYPRVRKLAQHFV